MNSKELEQLNSIIGDPIIGPYEGEDYSFDADGNIQISDNNVKLAATIMRKANTSGMFLKKFVKIGQRGDSILIGPDTLGDAVPVYKATIGHKNDTVVEVKKDVNGKFCLYVNDKRTRSFNRLATTKKYITTLDKEIQSSSVVHEYNDIDVEPDYVD